jgi:hypothetical protein
MITEDSLQKEYIIRDIIRGIEREGYNIEKSIVDDFLDNFWAQYDRLPKKKEIGPIITSYITLIKTQTSSPSGGQDNGNEGSQNNSFNSFIQDLSVQKKFLNTIKYDKSLYHSGKVLIISKPDGRRLCPICDNENWFKIHESTDKTDIISHYPRVYGKIYSCSGCGCTWKEK